MADSNIVGVGLNIDHDFLSEVVRNTALASIAEALDGDDHRVVGAIVQQVMNSRVDERGKPVSRSSYQWDNCDTILEYYVRKMLTEEVKAQVVQLIEDRREDIREMVRAELAKEATVDSFLDAFTHSLTGAFGNYWRPSMTITFKEED